MKVVTVIPSLLLLAQVVAAARKYCITRINTESTGRPAHNQLKWYETRDKCSITKYDDDALTIIGGTHDQGDDGPLIDHDMIYGEFKFNDSMGIWPSGFEEWDNSPAGNGKRFGYIWTWEKKAWKKGPACQKIKEVEGDQTMTGDGLITLYTIAVCG